MPPLCGAPAVAHSPPRPGDPGMLSSSAPKSAGMFAVRGKLDAVPKNESTPLVWTGKRTVRLVCGGVELGVFNV